MTRLLITIALTALLLTVWRCTFGSADGPPLEPGIERLLRDPGPLDGRLVTVSGVVADRVSVLGIGGFRLTAPSGDTLLVVGLGTAPQPGEPVTVTGIFRLGAAIGAYQAPVLLVR